MSADHGSIPGHSGLPRRIANALGTWIAAAWCAVAAAITSDARPGSHPGI